MVDEVKPARSSEIIKAERESVSEFLGIFAAKLPELAPRNFDRVQRLEAIEEALKADLNLTFMQMKRYFDAVPTDLDHFAHAAHPIEPVHMRRSRVVATFCGLNPRDVKQRPTILSHNVGAAEARLLLGASPTEWRASTLHRDLAHDPDAVYQPSSSPGTSIAVEYDRGSYTSKKIIDKITSFAQDYQGIIWVVPPPAENWGTGNARDQKLRKLFLRNERIANLQIPIQVMTAKWWEGETETVKRMSMKRSTSFKSRTV